MIKPDHELSIKRQAELLNIARGRQPACRVEFLLGLFLLIGDCGAAADPAHAGTSASPLAMFMFYR